MAPEPTKRKLVVVGDGATGKTSLLSVFSMGEFPQEYEPTIFENYVAEIRLDGKAVQLALWDTAGQESFERLRPLSYASAHVILICYAVDSPDSLENVTTKWIEEVRAHLKDVPVLLVGLKKDLRDGNQSPARCISTQEGEETAREIGAKAFFETSALFNEGVDEVFESATRQAMLVRTTNETSARRMNGANEARMVGSNRVGPVKSREERERSGCGCVVC
ncbi:GTP-binding protein rho2 [Microbotryum lychnidis-dioicae p1A1 Lamole]|uniref:GTP-binding protein rho2 n=1 Tax=Microbotryum lychnidis-dioicae (strain p1A1 Lamole / MvSl-1064) TaxID=683840 RepID=U5H7Y4_USTV1|nr:GTP-binding protein rho2 [Microbotryum lychnidis-dioicae p1A1 Lamole]|eukprot:KDE06314.1 GTP-binding protein rho2 [Microbotryum lychnidis-dioicae p1A1 Lamole]